VKILVACEFSGTVREAFRERGHVAYSCDLLPTEKPGPHLQMDVFDAIKLGWDMMIAFPPCTHLARSGGRWFKNKVKEQSEAVEFVRQLLDSPIPRIALENPIGVLSTRIRKPDQIIQPWMFGHEERKATCLWLKDLPKLEPTKIMERRDRNLTPTGQNKISPGPDRWKLRSKTYQGIAGAMAEQWGSIVS
jgi:hypothetical protein